jgi:hypothetical protein
MRVGNGDDKVALDHELVAAAAIGPSKPNARKPRTSSRRGIGPQRGINPLSGRDSNEHPLLDHLGELVAAFLERGTRRQHALKLAYLGAG